MNEIIEELTGYMKTIETFDKDSGQDAQALHSYLIELTNFMARANFLMADFQRKFRQQKKNAYTTLSDFTKSQGNKFSPLLAKDYIDSLCHDTGFVYDLAERLSRLCSHTIDAIRTVISSLKSEREFAQYQQ